MESTGPLELPDGSQLGILGIAGDSIVPQSLERRAAGMESQPVLVPLEVSPDEIEEIPPDVDPLTGIPETRGTNNNLTLKLANNSEAPLLLDIDRNGRLEALTDGILIIRHMWGYSGEFLVQSAVAPDGTRTDAAEITSYIDELIDELGLVLDVDGDGKLMPGTDALLIIRYLWGSSGELLIQGAIGPGATRNTAKEVTAYLDELLSMTVTPEGENQAPVLEPVGDLEVMPGGRLEVQLQATDPDGDGIIFSLGNSEDLPAGMLEGNGTLVFTPTIDELGTYNFTVIASDGELEATREVTLKVIPDTVTTTRISGAIQNTKAEPLAGVPIELGNLRTVTAADGSFTIEITGTLSDDTLKVRGEKIAGDLTYPFIAEKLPLLLGRDPLTGVNNVISRPIFLPAIDIDNGVKIDPSVDTMVTTDAIPGAEVFVAAGTLKSMDGGLFTGQLSITEVPRDLTPASLPENLLPDVVVTVQPGEMVFTTPAPLSMPNEAGYDPGTEMDLWSINPETGAFERVGTGEVSADGSKINTIKGGIRNSSWHFFVPPPDVPIDPEDNPRNQDDESRCCEMTAPGTSEVELHSGAVLESHDLVPYQSLGASRGLTLSYDSLRADPRPIRHFGYANVQADQNRRLVAELAISRGDFEFQVPGFAGADYGLELVENPDGSVLLIDGDGDELLFEASATGDGYESPPGDFSTLKRLPKGTFQRTMKDRTVYSFNGQNQLARMVDRNGNKTKYVYREGVRFL